MALVIKGHPTRRNEVVEIFRMLGGREVGYSGFGSLYYYYINEYDNIIGTTKLPDSKTFVIYTLEEFLEKFPYKVGETVVVSETHKVVTIEDMSWRNGREVIYETLYEDDCFECFSAAELQPYEEKEETSEEIKIDIPDSYEFAGVDDDKQQVIFTKIHLQYPKNYEECSLINGCDNRISLKIIGEFIRLINVRNAYWKIAGEQMGLGKSWKPSKNDNVYCIFRLKGEIVKDNFVFGDSLILEFPTEKMRNAFYENFKDLIEECKELL